MKILLANWIYNWGSTGFIIRDLKTMYEAQGHEVIVAAAEQRGNDKGVFLFGKPIEWKVMSRLARIGWPRFKGSKRASKQLLQLIGRVRPDVVHIHLLHGAKLDLYFLLKRLGQEGVKTVVTNHAELYYTGCCEHAYDCTQWLNNECRNCPNKLYATYAYVFANAHLHWKLMKEAFSYFKPENLMFTAVSPWVCERFYNSPITKGFNCSVVLNGTDVSTYYRRQYKKEIFDRIGGGVDSYVLHVTASFIPGSKGDVKGGYYLIELAQRMPDVTFVVVCTASKIDILLPANIYLWGKAKDKEELTELYSNAQLTLIVSRRETFSMVTAESLCCGTPVVGFRAGGPDSIAIEEASCFVEQGDVNALKQAIREMNGMTIDRTEISNKAREKYSAQTMADGYLAVYEQLLNKHI